MSKVFADALGVVTAFSEGRVGDSPDPPSAAVFEFDGTTNPQLAAQLVVSLAPFRLTGGVLTRDGQPVPITADGPAERDRKRLQEMWAVLNSGDPITQPQLKIILRYLVRQAATEFRDT